MQRPSSFISRMRKYRSDDPFCRVLPFSSSTFTVASVMNSKFRTCNSTGRFSPILSLYRSHGVHFSVKCPAECRGNKEAPSRHAPSVSPHVAVLSRRLHEGQWERRLCNQSSMLFRRQLSQSWRGWMRVHEKGRESRATSSHPVNHSHPPPPTHLVAPLVVYPKKWEWWLWSQGLQRAPLTKAAMLEPPAAKQL